MAENPQQKMDPEQAMRLITELLTTQNQGQATSTAPQYQAGEGSLPLKVNPRSKQMYLERPNASSLGRLFGIKTIKEPLKDRTNYLPVLRSIVGNDAQLPGNLPVNEAGEPHVSLEVFKNMVTPELAAMRLSKQGTSSVPGQLKGDLRDGTPVTYDPRSRNYLLPSGEVYNKGKHGELTRPVESLPSAEERTELARLLDNKKQVIRLNQLFDPKFTGLAEEKLGQFASLTGVDIKDLKIKYSDEVKFRTAYQTMVNDYIKAATGAQMSEPEAKRIMKALPKLGSSDNAFVPALQEVQRLVDQKLETRLDMLEGLGIRGIGELRKQAEKIGKTSLGSLSAAGGAPATAAASPQSLGGLQVGGVIPGTNIRIKSVKLKGQ